MSERLETKRCIKALYKYMYSFFSVLSWWYGWHGFEQRIIDNAIDEFCKRL